MNEPELVSARGQPTGPAQPGERGVSSVGSSLRILITVFAKAPWGGLHENVLAECKALIGAAYNVTVAVAQSRLAELLRLAGARVILVDWDHPTSAQAAVARCGPFDLIHAHPFASRELGLRLQAIQKPQPRVVVTFHGNYLDGVESWGGSIDLLLAVSDSHRDMLRAALPDYPAHRIVVLPNGVDDQLFEHPIERFGTRTEGGVARVALASRLDDDKTELIEQLRSTVVIAKEARPDLQWTVDLIGEGSSKSRFVQALQQENGVSLNRFGWLRPRETHELLRRATLAVAPGRAAAACLAVGTPVLAVGSQGSYGFQAGEEICRGLWGNFGGFPSDEEISGKSNSVLQAILSDNDLYASVQDVGRHAIETQLRQSIVDRKLISLFEQLLSFTRTTRSSHCSPRS